MNLAHSNYNFETKYKNAHLIYNFKSGFLISLDEDNYKNFEILENITDEKTINALLQYGFIINKDENELLDLNLNHSISKNNNKDLFLTIQTTLGCNFACPYCYQNHNTESLTKESVNRLKKFIENKINQGCTNISVHWFGGEPLLKQKEILELEEYFKIELLLKYPNIKLNNGITTNGYLLTKSFVDNLIDKTNINSVQITLDGPEEIHNKSRILKNNKGTFLDIINNIKYLINRTNKIDVILRTNLNKKNINSIEKYMKFLEKEQILYNKNVKLHFQETQNFNGNSNSDLFYSTRKEFSKDLLKIYKLLHKYNLRIPRYPSSLFLNCKFDAINSYVLSPDLKIYDCSASENISDFELGYIDEYGKLILNNKYYKKFKRNVFNKEKCTKCKFIPICMGGCQNMENRFHDECIPDSYIFEDIIKIYYDEKIKGIENV